MGLKIKFLVTFLIISTVLSGAYCFIATFYAPLFFHDTFLLTAYVEKTPSDNLGNKELFFSSYLRYEKRNSPSATTQMPDDKEELQKLLNEGWRIIHRFRGRILPIWLRKNKSPVVPFQYSVKNVYFKKTQDTYTCTGSSSPGGWGLIIPHFDCELAFIITSHNAEKILFFPTGITKNDMWKVRQKYKGENSTYTRINIPPPETLTPVDKTILDFMEKDDYLRLSIERNKNTTRKK